MNTEGYKKRERAILDYFTRIINNIDAKITKDQMIAIGFELKSKIGIDSHQILEE